MAGQRAAMVMSLVQSAKLHGHDPWVYLKDVLERLLAHPNNRIDELLPHRWKPAGSTAGRGSPSSSRWRGQPLTFLDLAFQVLDPLCIGRTDTKPRS